MSPDLTNAHPAPEVDVPGADLAIRAAKLVLIALVLAAGWDDLRHLGRRWRRITASWWDGIEHLEREEMHRAELDYFLRQLTRPHAPSRSRAR